MQDTYGGGWSLRKACKNYLFSILNIFSSCSPYNFNGFFYFWVMFLQIWQSLMKIYKSTRKVPGSSVNYSYNPPIIIGNCWILLHLPMKFELTTGGYPFWDWKNLKTGELGVGPYFWLKKIPIIPQNRGGWVVKSVKK